MLYTFAGTSVLKGVLKVRFANSDARAKQLAKLGDTDVNIVPLPSACDKESAVRYLLENGFAKTDEVRAALEAEIAPKRKPAGEVKVKVRVAKTSKTAKPKTPKTKPEVEVTDAEVDRLYEAVYGNE